MFQDIGPYVFHNEYSSRKPEEDDILIVQKGRDILMNCGQTLPTVAQVRAVCSLAAEQAYYLLSIDEKHFFCTDVQVPETENLSYTSVMILREMNPGYMGFGGSVSWQLASWYDLHRYCGRCVTKTEHSERERAIICPKCGQKLRVPRGRGRIEIRCRKCFEQFIRKS